MQCWAELGIPGRVILGKPPYNLHALPPGTVRRRGSTSSSPPGATNFFHVMDLSPNRRAERPMIVFKQTPSLLTTPLPDAEPRRRAVTMPSNTATSSSGVMSGANATELHLYDDARGSADGRQEGRPSKATAIDWPRRMRPPPRG